MPQELSSSTADAPRDARDDTALDPRRWLAFAVVLVAGFVDLVDSTIVNVAIPSIQRDLQADYVQLEWVVAAYVLSFAGLLILSGRLGDIYGRKRIFMIGMAAFTVASLSCGLSVSPAMLIASRLAQGAAAGLMVTQILAILRVTFPAHERGKAVALFGGVTGSSALFGLALGGVIVQWDLFGWEWRTIFLINVPVGIASLIAGAVFLRESRSARRPRLDAAGMVLALAAVTLLVYPLTQGRHVGWAGWTFAMPAGAVLLLVVFVAYEMRRFATIGSALVEFGVFRSRQFSVGMGMWWLFWIASGGFFFVWTLFLQAGLGWSPMHAGLTAATLAIGVGIGAGNAPTKLVPKFGSRVLVAGGIINAAGWLLLAWLITHFGQSLNSWQLIPAHLLCGIGFGFIVAPSLDMLLGQVPHDQAGNASGLLNTVQQVGIALGVATLSLGFFAQLDSGHQRGADAATPALQSQLAADPQQQQVLAAFRACVTDRSASFDPSRTPASCDTGALSPGTATAFRAAVATADAKNFAYAFASVLIGGALVLLIVAIGFLALPRRAQMVNPLLDEPESEIVTA
ncbi:MFS transporter [Planomonospora sp. ID67723]|uniref:MFS transporter n=1 Tax=Planomonospora sp. ID67723 TaxID=2738134 RepID=UPI0018C37288|nr:MFS transporter [Planomonospora sp. ID67723]MBG0831916.1 MFS transporter [Planomonospora sp. ID67723]